MAHNPKGKGVIVSAEPEVTTVQAEVPVQLLAEVRARVAAGWFRSFDEVLLDALRRYLDSHRDALIKALLREDVEWGLRGKD
jgi:Arc/MetJ-type ribon-helix-helix transcriptional regulator